ncbi:heme-dependent oxidative N-demethylase family protein [Aeromicrobium sp.]|uniref:heme-dependent oxidative N-demethylase family protein n=1 Tax=Aeromicrobium sp. TaxID=1871063 RepID=UPI002FC6E1EA
MSVETHSQELSPAAAAYLSRPVDHCATLPWPFPDDLSEFRYSVNVDPAMVPRPTAAGEWGRTIVDLGGAEYPAMMADRRRILDEDPHRVKLRPGMELAAWDLLLYYFRDLDRSYPELMHLDENVGDDPRRFRWRNLLLGTDQEFVLGEWGSIPYGPFEFLAREVPDDLLLVVERDGRLYFDAGAVTFAAAWSVSFDVGMDMYEIHSPVPGLTRDGITARAEQFLMRLPADKVYRRVNWTLSASGSRKLDVSLEELPEWGTDVPVLVRDGRWGDLQLRIEVEHFIRLPMTGAVTFNIRTHMASLDEIKVIPTWARQLATVIEELPEDLATYKGFADYRHEVVPWLRS